MKKILTLLMLAATIQLASATKINVTGTIIDRQDKKPVTFADVVAYKMADSTRKAQDASLTDDKGNFELKLQPGEYAIDIEYLGYKKQTKQITVKEGNGNQDLGQIQLRPDIQALEGVVVKAQAVAVQTKGDTIEYNAGSFRVAEGSMLEDLVKKLPGAQVADDGTVTVNGKQIKKILVDGKEFFSDDPKVALKNLPSNMVEKVKSYDKKSDEAKLTGMDDGEDEAVLDLTVKKEMKHGWFGNLQAGLGGTPFHHDINVMMSRFDDDQNISLIGSSNDVNSSSFGEKGGGPQGNTSNGNGLTQNTMAGINYIKDKTKVKFGGNARYGYSDNDAKKKSETEMFLNEGSNYTRDTSRSQRKRHDVSVDFQLNWQIDSMTTLIFRPNLSYANTKVESRQNSHTLNNSLLETNRTSGSSNTEGDNLTAGGMLRFNRRLNKKGRNFGFNAKVDYSYAQSDEYSRSNSIFHIYDDDEDEESAYTDSLLSLNRYTDNNSHSLTYRIGAQYTEPISTHHLMQLRYTYQRRETESESYVYDQDSEIKAYVDSLSSKVDNRYDNHEAELNIQGKFTKARYKIGFNVSPQTTDNETSIGPNAGRDLSQTVWNFAPNLMFRYTFDRRHSLMLRYRGQSSAPSVSYLQEIIDQTDPLNIKYGNPDLKASFTNNMMLRYNNYFSKKQSNLAANFSWQNTLNNISDKVVYDNATGTRKTYKSNIDGNWNTSGFITYMTPIGKKGFRLSTETHGRYTNNVAYAAETKYAERKSITKNTSLGEKLTGTYQRDDFDINVHAGLTYVNADNNLNNKADRETKDWDLGASTNITLPWKMQFSTSLTYKIYNGYADQFKDNELLWNAQLQKSFLKNNAATVRVKVFDILQQQSGLKRTITANSISDAEYNQLGTYFMIYFAYKINTLGKEGQRKEGPEGRGRFDFGPGGPRDRTERDRQRREGEPQDENRPAPPDHDNGGPGRGGIPPAGEHHGGFGGPMGDF